MNGDRRHLGRDVVGAVEKTKSKHDKAHLLSLQEYNDKLYLDITTAACTSLDSRNCVIIGERQPLSSPFLNIACLHRHHDTPKRRYGTHLIVSFDLQPISYGARSGR